MTRARFRLGIDFGTSTTVAVLRRPDGRVQQLLFDGSPLLSSAVLLGPDGRLHTGRDAAHLARSAPERLEPNPKRRVDERTVLLGDAEVDVQDLIAAVLRRVATEATRVTGETGKGTAEATTVTGEATTVATPVDTVTLTHPADWGTARRALLVQAARLAGFADVDLVAEPVAAATYLAAVQDVPIGSCIVVYDLGAGTCDVTLLRRQPDGFAPVASGGLNELGGLDVDAAVVGFLQATYGTLWTDAATRRQLWDDVRTAKEMLSRASGTVVMVPALGKEVPLGREQLEGLIRPVLRPSVAMTRALLAEAGVQRREITGLFLVGGSSRIPLVATMLHESLGIAPVVAEQPELVVAEGSLQLDSGGTSPEPPHDPPPPPPAAIAPTRPRRKSRARLLVAAAAAVLIATGGVVVATQLLDDGTPGTQSSDPRSSGGPPPPYDFLKIPDNLCLSVDFTPFATLYDEQDSIPTPTRHLLAASGDAACVTTRLDDGGVVRADLAFAIRVTGDETLAGADYQSAVGGVAKVNERPVAVAGLGQEAVVFEMKDSAAQAKKTTTMIVGVRDRNLVCQVRLSVVRRDNGGWTAAQKQDLRDRLVKLATTALPKVTAGLR